MKNRSTITEEIKRMQHLINFNVGSHSHDFLAEQNFDVSVGEVEDFFWTSKSAQLFNESVIKEIKLINEQDEKEGVDLNLDDGGESEVDDDISDLDDLDYEELYEFGLYYIDYIEKLTGEKLPLDLYSDMLEDEYEDEDEDESIDESFNNLNDLLLERCGKACRSNRRQKAARKIKNFFKKLKRFFRLKRRWRNFKGNVGDTVKDFNRWFRRTRTKLKRKFKTFRKDSARAIKRKIKNIKRALKRGIYLSWYRPGDTHDMVSTKEYKIKTPEDEWGEYVKSSIANKMVRKMNSRSQKNWESLIADEENLSFAVAAVEYFEETNRKTKWKNVIVGLDKETIINKLPDNDDNKPKEYPKKPINFPNTIDPGKLFIDNCSDIGNAPGLKTEVDNLVSKVQEALQDLNPPEGEFKAKLNAINLEASSSRFRNGKSGSCDASTKTWKQLSEERLKTVRDYIIERLKEIGVVVNTADGGMEENYNSDGENGDGSSGPHPGKVHPDDPSYRNANIKKIVDSGKEFWYAQSNDGTRANTLSGGGKLADGSSQLKKRQTMDRHEKKSDYDKYKYIRGKIVLILNTNEGGGKSKGDDDDKIHTIETTTTEYPITFYKPPRGGDVHLKIDLPKLKFALPKNVRYWLYSTQGGGGSGPSGCEWKK